MVFFGFPRGPGLRDLGAKKTEKHTQILNLAVNVVKVRVAVLPHFGAERNGSPPTFCKSFNCFFWEFFCLSFGGKLFAVDNGNALTTEGSDYDRPQGGRKTEDEVAVFRFPGGR